MSIPNIGVGSPITIANINEIINGINKIANDLQLLKAQVDRVSLSSTGGGDATSIIRIKKQQLSNKDFTFTVAELPIPSTAIFKGADILAIVDKDGKNILRSDGYNAKVEVISGVDTKKINFKCKVSRNEGATYRNVPQTETLSWKFLIDYEVPTN